MKGAASSTAEPVRAGAIAEIERVDALARRHATPCGDGHMVWREWGSGPPVVLLHGGFGSWLHWIRNIEALARHYRVLACDTPGLGESALIPEPVSPADIGEVVQSGLVSLLEPAERCDIVAFSFGGVVAGQIAPRLGRRLRSIILAGASGLGIARTLPVEMIRRTPDMTQTERDTARRHNIMALMLAHERNLDDLAFEIQVRNDDNARMKSRRFSLGVSLRDALPQITARVNGIWGELDVTANRDAGPHRDLIAQTHPDTDFRIVSSAGHWVAYEASDAFNAAALQMLGKADD